MLLHPKVLVALLNIFLSDHLSFLLVPWCICEGIESEALKSPSILSGTWQRCFLPDCNIAGLDLGATNIPKNLDTLRHNSIKMLGQNRVYQVYDYMTSNFFGSVNAITNF